MEKFTISEYFTLPSKGLVYNNKVASEIHMSSMTTRHEMQRLAPTSTSQFKVLCDIIDDCMIDKIDMSSYDMCTGDYQFLLFKLRTATYGSDITLKTTCPHCGKVYEVKFSIDDLPVISDIESFNKYRTFTLPKTGREITLNYQTPHMLDRVIEAAKEYSDRVGSDAVDQTLVYTIKELINTVDGHKPDPINVDDWVRNLPMLDTNTIFAYSSKMDESIGIESKVEIGCNRCGKSHEVNIKPGPDFFRPEINI